MLDALALHTAASVRMGVTVDWYVLGYLYSATQPGREIPMPPDRQCQIMMLNGVASEFGIWIGRHDGVPAN